MTEFSLSVPSNMQLLNWGIAGFLLLTMVALFIRRSGAQRLLGVLVTGAVLVLMVYLSFVAPAQTRVVIGEALEVHTPPYAREIVQREEVLRAFVADWSKDQDLRPKVKSGGVAFGGYRAGKFKLANGSRAVIMANGTKVVAVELEDKYLLLAPDGFDDFVAALNDRFVPVD